MNPKIDEYLSKVEQWQEEMECLRQIILSCQLTEEWKWKIPCYTFQEKNIVGMYGLKATCALSFFKGALLQDPHNLLIKPGENSQSGRWVKFTNVQEIVEKEAVLKAYIYEAIEIEKAGVKVDFTAGKKLVYPEEFQTKLEEDIALKTAFENLTPGRQRGYNLYFSAPKQSKTRSSRIEKYVQKILDGYGFHDCTCGRSKRMPTCDGSHKYIK